MTLDATTNGTDDGRSAPPSVAFGEGRRPDATTTHVRLPEFQGPLGLLLALIEARQLDVLTVPLGALADAYLDALASLEDDRLGNVSAFVSVASQLILIKSRAMLPRQAEALLRHGLFRREPSAAAAAALAGARPADAPPLDPMLLGWAIAGLVRIAPPVELPPETIRRTITLTERADFIREAILAAGADPVVLQELLRGVRDRVVVAVTFLALLELMKRREIVVTQDEPWGPIVARRSTPDERGTTGSGDEDAPLDERMESFA